MDEETKVAEVKGAFITSLRRNFKQIREDRAEAIDEDVQLLYKRKVEDLRVSIKRMERERDNMYDITPANTTSLVFPSDFDSDDYVNKDIELGVKIRNEKIRLEIAGERYRFLFGTEV